MRIKFKSLLAVLIIGTSWSIAEEVAAEIICLDEIMWMSDNGYLSSEGLVDIITKCSVDPDCHLISDGSYPDVPDNNVVGGNGAGGHLSDAVSATAQINFREMKIAKLESEVRDLKYQTLGRAHKYKRGTIMPTPVKPRQRP